MSDDYTPVSLEEAVRRMVVRQPPIPPAPCEDAPTPDGDDVVEPDEEGCE